MATINLALNRPATASNSVMPYAPSMAVNGVVTPFSRWLCNKTPGWLCVDFGAPYWINRWVARNMPVAGWRAPDYNMCDFRLQGSNDNVNWTDIDVVSNNTATIYDKTFTPAFFRYARVYVTNGLRTNPQYASLMEFEVYQAPSAYLTGLTVSSGAISPTFAMSTFAYTTANVAYSTSSITVTPIAEDPQASIKVNGVAVVSGQAATVALNVGSNAIPVVVTGAGGAPSNTYTVTVTRNSTISSYLSALSAQVGGANMSWTELMQSPFVKTTTLYSFNVGFDAQNIMIVPTSEDSTATVAISVNNITVNSGTSTALNIGLNVIKVTVTATGGASVTTYTLNVTRAGSTYLSAISCTRGAAIPAVSKTPPFNYSLKAGITAATTTITLTAEDAVTTTISLQVDANTYTSTTGQLVVQAVPTAPSPGKTVTATVSSSTSVASTVYTISVIKAN